MHITAYCLVQKSYSGSSCSTWISEPGVLCAFWRTLVLLLAKEGRENCSEDVTAGLKPWRLASIVIASLGMIPDCPQEDSVGLLSKAIPAGRFCSVFRMDLPGHFNFIFLSFGFLQFQQRKRTSLGIHLVLRLTFTFFPPCYNYV